MRWFLGLGRRRLRLLRRLPRRPLPDRPSRHPHRLRPRRRLGNPPQRLTQQLAQQRIKRLAQRLTQQLTPGLAQHRRSLIATNRLRDRLRNLKCR